MYIPASQPLQRARYGLRVAQQRRRLGHRRRARAALERPGGRHHHRRAAARRRVAAPARVHARLLKHARRRSLDSLWGEQRRLLQESTPRILLIYESYPVARRLLAANGEVAGHRARRGDGRAAVPRLYLRITGRSYISFRIQQQGIPNVPAFPAAPPASCCACPSARPRAASAAGYASSAPS